MALKFTGGKAVARPMNQQQFDKADYSLNQMIQAMGRLNESAKLLKSIGKDAAAAKLTRASEMVREEADRIREDLANN